MHTQLVFFRLSLLQAQQQAPRKLCIQLIQFIVFYNIEFIKWTQIAFYEYEYLSLIIVIELKVEIKCGIRHWITNVIRCISIYFGNKLYNETNKKGTENISIPKIVANCFYELYVVDVFDLYGHYVFTESSAYIIS